MVRARHTIPGHRRKLFYVAGRMLALLVTFSAPGVGKSQTQPLLFGDRPVFKADFSRKKVFPGEPTVVTFYLESATPLLEVEVAKFPEFRGYWSENLSLRQGPIALGPSITSPGLYQGAVGSYSLYAMEGFANPRLEPMRILVRWSADTANGRQEAFLQSEIPALETKPLPALPKQFEAAGFSGAVGHFYLSPDKFTQTFSSNEPMTVRVALQGDGNFAEVNRLPIEFPAGVEVLSTRTFLQGNGSYFTKTFDYTISVTGTEGAVVPAKQWVYFNPSDARYEAALLPEIRFEYTPAVAALAAESLAPIEWPEFATTYSLTQTWWRSGWFWLPHLIALLLGLAARLVPLVQSYVNSPARRERGARRLQIAEAQTYLAAGQAESFFLSFRSMTPYLAQQAVTPEAQRAQQKLKDASDRFFYSPEKSAGRELPELLGLFTDATRS